MLIKVYFGLLISTALEFNKMRAIPNWILYLYWRWYFTMNKIIIIYWNTYASLLIRISFMRYLAILPLFIFIEHFYFFIIFCYVWVCNEHRISVVMSLSMYFSKTFPTT